MMLDTIFISTSGVRCWIARFVQAWLRLGSFNERFPPYHDMNSWRPIAVRRFIFVARPCRSRTHGVGLGSEFVSTSAQKPKPIFMLPFIETMWDTKMDFIAPSTTRVHRCHANQPRDGTRDSRNYKNTPRMYLPSSRHVHLTAKSSPCYSSWSTK